MNVISHLTQSKAMQFDIAIECIKKYNQTHTKYKGNGFVSAQISVRELAQELEMEPDEIRFPAATSLRRLKLHKQFDYKSIDLQIQKKISSGIFQYLVRSSSYVID